MSDAPDNLIAVVGMACRLPGARNPREYWRNLRDGVESVRVFTDDELRTAGVSERLLRDPRYVKSGVVLDGLEMFDAEFFGFSPKEAAIMDPQHRQFLECAWEAIEDSGHVPERFDGAISVFAGCGMGAYFAYNVLRNRELLDTVGLFLLRHTGNDKDFLATRVSYCFDLKGPSVNVQTACSTSLVAVHAAMQSLNSFESDMALAGGVTLEIPHRQGYLFAEGEILSPDGHCRAFDHRSAGTVFGSGAGVVVLRRLADALQDGDNVYAVIRSSAINNDGAGKVGYLAPSVDGQAAAVAEAIGMAQVDARSIDYVECHGTGTAMGDPIEVAALQQAFGSQRDRQFCGLGSVKTNIGHLDTAAGVASLIKVCLALHHGELPPSLNYEAPNAQIDFQNSPFFVNHRLRPWPRGSRPRRAGVNSLGVGGTNAHVIVEEAPAPAMAPVSRQPHHLLVLSARNNGALDGNAERLAAHLAANPGDALADVAHTLAAGRRAFARRRVLVAPDHAGAIALLRGEQPQRVYTHTATVDAKVVFLLPGGGAQYRHMGADLYRTEPVFRQHVDAGLKLLEGRLDVDLREVWLGDKMTREQAEAAFDRPSVQLPAIFLLEYALAQLWLARGVQPVALLGHSLGENTAACLAGTFRFADALQLVTLRGQLFEKVPAGGMLSVPLSREQLLPLLGDDLDLAVVNAPSLCVVSGSTAALERLAAELLAREVECQRVRIAIAAHSRMLAPILAEFDAFLRSIPLAAPKIPFLSNRTGKLIRSEEATDPRYWVDHLRHTVDFAGGVGTLLEDPQHVFLEVGPGRTLSSLVRQHPRWQQDRSAIASLRHPDEQVCDAAFLLGAHGRLWAAGVTVDLAALVPGQGRRRLSLPTYAFRHQPYWVDADPVTTATPQGDELRRIDDVTHWGFAPRWVAAPAAAPAAEGTGPWLVFMDDCGFGDELCRQLRARGEQCFEVHLGDAYLRRGSHRFVLSPEMGREGYDALLRDLAAEGRLPRTIVHAWLLTVDHSFRPGSSWFHRCEEQGFFSLFFLAQALGSEDRPPVRLFVLGNALVACAGGTAGTDGVPEPAKALALGPALVMPRELTDLHSAVFDIELPRGRRRVRQAHWQRVAHELIARGQAEDGVFAWRTTGVLQRTHTPAPLPAVAAPRLQQRGTYLLTGGLGGIGLLVAEYLARTCTARLVLVSRRKLPPREQWNAHLAEHGANDAASRAITRVRALEGLGAEVLVCSADVANPAGMGQAIAAARQRFGRIDGVFHAAGVVQDGLIAQKDQASLEEVLTPKVQGALILDELLRQEPPAFTVLFSSSSAVLAPAGQVDYVAANAFLNALAAQRTQQGMPTVAVQWGVWQGVGMTEAAHHDAAVTGRPQPIRQPWFHELRQVGSDQWLLAGELSCDGAWLLDEHRTLDGAAVVPGTGYLTFAAQSLAARGETAAFEVRDLFFFRPLHVADGDVRPVRSRLRKSLEGYEWTLQSESVLDDGRRGWQTHAQARLLLSAMAAPGAVHLSTIAADCPRAERADGAALRTGQFAHMRFGPRWQVLRELRLGDGQALARLELPAQFAAEAREQILHPALLDIATGFAMALVPGYQGTELWVPLSYRSVRVHGPLPATIWSHVHRCRAVGSQGDMAAFDLTITDADGRVLLQVEEFTIKQLRGERAFALAPVPTAAEVELAERGGGNSPAEKFLAETIHEGIRPAEGMEALARLLSAPLPADIVISSLPLDQLRRRMAAAAAPAAATARFARPDLDNDYVAPTDDLERTLAQFFEELLGVQQVGTLDNFFDLGGHSLIAVRLFAKIKKAFQIDYPMSVLFEAPTVAKVAAMLRRDRGDAVASAGESGGGEVAVRAPAPKSRYQHLVAMHPGQVDAGTPFFLVAGMFGNVLNLRHLAQLLGHERPFYGLQARGLFGDTAPHEDFVEAARDHLQEIRSVQPHGPYLLGGFSGGGITAYEIARQLLAAGEQVALLVLLDTPLPLRPTLSKADKLKIKLQTIRREGLQYLGRWMRSRWQWEVERLRRRFGGRDAAQVQAGGFHNERIEQAFRTALGKYRIAALPVHTVLFRPALDHYYDLGGGRFVSRAKEFVMSDNGWTPFLADLQIVEVPGDHDGMVLEPNVRVLAEAMREAIAGAVGQSIAAESKAR